jgi:hypothetical protein
MQKQIDAISASSGKVRRKLFAEIGALHKICVEMQRENVELKQMLNVLRDEKIEWNYIQNDKLFEVINA